MTTNDELRTILQAAIKKSGDNISQWARENDLEDMRGNISLMVHGHRKISEVVADKLGYEKEEGYKKKTTTKNW